MESTPSTGPVDVPFRFVNVVWGTAFVDQFVNVCLPTQLTMRNLRALAERCPASYHLYTSKQDLPAVTAAPAFRALQRIMSVEVLDIADVVGGIGTSEQRYGTMSACHRHFTQSGQVPGAALVFLSPDSIWSDGTFAALVDFAARGKRLVVISSLRVTRETFVPSFTASHRVGYGVFRPITGREMVALSLRHLHPEGESLVWGVPQSNTWPSNLFWRVDNEGYLARAFHLHPLMVRPVRDDIFPRSTIDDDYVFAACPDPADIEIVTSSDEICGFDITERNERMQCVRPGAKTPSAIATWAQSAANARHREFARVKFYFQTGDTSSPAWRQAEADSDQVIDSVLSALGAPASAAPPSPSPSPPAPSLPATPRGLPSLSVFLPNYNHGHLIGETLESMLAQSVQATEIIVVDDASTDDSVQVVERFMRRAPHIRLVRNERNRGPMYGANLAAQQAVGEYFYGIGADDRTLPGLFEKSLRLLAAHPDAGLCCSDPASMDSEGKTFRPNPLRWSPEARFFSPDDLADMLHGEYIAGHTTIVKKTAFVQAGGYLEDLAWHCDWFCWLVVGFRHGICYVPEPLALIRESPGGYSSAGRRDWDRQKQVMEAVLRHLKSPGLADVVARFARANALSHLGVDEMVRLVMGSADHWDPKTIMLTQAMLARWSQKFLVPPEVWRHQTGRAQRTTIALQRVREAVSTGNLADARQVLRALVAEYPDTPAAYLSLAHVEDAAGNSLGAIEILREGLRQNPNDPQLRSLVRPAG